MTRVAVAVQTSPCSTHDPSLGVLQPRLLSTQQHTVIPGPLPTLPSGVSTTNATLGPTTTRQHSSILQPESPARLPHRTPSATFPLLHLPPEILLLITLHLPYPDLLALQLTCRYVAFLTSRTGSGRLLSPLEQVERWSRLPPLCTRAGVDGRKARCKNCEGWGWGERVAEVASSAKARHRAVEGIHRSAVMVEPTRQEPSNGNLRALVVERNQDSTEHTRREVGGRREYRLGGRGRGGREVRGRWRAAAGGGIKDGKNWRDR